MPDYRGIADDIRMIAANRGVQLTEREVDTAVRLHLRGKAYVDAIKMACGRKSNSEEMKGVSQKEARLRSAAIGGRLAAERAKT